MTVYISGARCNLALFSAINQLLLQHTHVVVVFSPQVFFIIMIIFGLINYTRMNDCWLLCECAFFYVCTCLIARFDIEPHVYLFMSICTCVSYADFGRIVYVSFTFLNQIFWVRFWTTLHVNLDVYIDFQFDCYITFLIDNLLIREIMFAVTIIQKY